MIKHFLPHVLRLLQQHNILITFVDVGSRNGVLELADIAEFVEAYGFEPNPSEYEKLVKGTADALLYHGISSPPYRKLSYFPFALGDFCGKHELYITRGPGACCMLEPNMARLSEIRSKGGMITEQKPFEEQFAKVDVIEVDVKTLDVFVKDNSIKYVDYLKIDVEGFEYQLLEGSRTILANTGVIKVEVSFIPVRKEQKLFSHIDLLLRDFGFDLLRYEIHSSHIVYKERGYPLRYIPSGFPDPGGQVLSCDAIYVNRDRSEPERALAQAMVLLELDYADEALHVLRTKTDVEDREFFELLRNLRGGSLGQTVRQAGHESIDKIVDMAGSVARLIRR